MTFGDLTIKLPCFVRSVSSYETQLKPDAALEALRLIPTNEAVLVSAYDLYIRRNDIHFNPKDRDFILNILKELRSRGCLIVIDSGNYEASRKKDKTWNRKKYLEAIDGVSKSYVFCFDNLEPPEVVDNHIMELVNDIQKSGDSSTLPIVHAPLSRSKTRLPDVLPQIFCELAKKLKPPFIAVPERELGDGILARARNVRNIRAELNRLSFYQPIHLLGTGNPISLAVYAGAGADLFDGLEWCRTVVDRNSGLLYHHQQYDFFRHQTRTLARFDFVRASSENEQINPMLKMALHNLDFLHVWMEEIRDNVKSNNISEMLAAYLPTDVYKEIRKDLSEIFNK